MTTITDLPSPRPQLLGLNVEPALLARYQAAWSALSAAHAAVKSAFDDLEHAKAEISKALPVDIALRDDPRDPDSGALVFKATAYFDRNGRAIELPVDFDSIPF